MSKFRRLLSIGMACIMIVSMVSTNVFASEQVESNTIFFNEADFIGLSDLERGIAKLEIMGFDEDLINDLSENEIITKYSNAVSYSKNDKYFKEIPANDNVAVASLDSEVGLNLVEISEAAYNEIVANNLETETNTTIENELQPLTENTLTYGTLKLTTGATHQGGGDYYFWSRYEWTTPPDYRGKDIFGLSKDSNVALKDSEFYSVTKYTKKTYQYYAGTSAVTRTLISSNEIWDERYEGDWDYNGTGGFAVEANLPDDFVPVQMLQGTFQTGYTYTDMKGYMSCDGSVTHPTVNTNFNIFTTYGHQKSYYMFGFGVSIPGGASISVQPTSDYETKSCSIYERYYAE